MLGLNFDKGGIYLGWSDLFDYSSLDTLEASEELPLPSGKKYKYLSEQVDEEIKKNYIDISLQASEIITENNPVIKIKLLARLLKELNKRNEFIIRISEFSEEDAKSFIDLYLNKHEQTQFGQQSDSILKNFIASNIQRLIQKTGNIPDALKPYELIKVNISSLLGEVKSDGQNENRLQLLVDELKTKKNIILFIDEVHLLVNRNTANMSIDFANMLKPGLDRGVIKMIGATTDEEYEAYILRDRAFLRRFLKVDVLEPTEDQCVQILLGTYPKYEKRTGVKLNYTDFIKEKIFRFIVELTDEYKRIYEIGNRYPDIALTIVMSAFSMALYENSKEVKLKHFYKAICRTKAVYEDAKVKEIARFKEIFKDIILEENVDLNDM